MQNKLAEFCGLQKLYVFVLDEILYVWSNHIFKDRMQGNTFLIHLNFYL